MENRIQINGVWYVREDQQDIPVLSIDDSDITNFEGCVYENVDFCWEATRIKRDDGSLYKGVDIKFTNKRGMRPWTDQYWDNNPWFLGVYNNHPDALVEAHESMGKEDTEVFRAFIGKLIEKGWLEN